ncbi:MAG TPA: hypothetical protein EYM35_05765 [Rhodospirillales bacterium]|nr:hypothetical protein [Rhodospirillales bacterium]
MTAEIVDLLQYRRQKARAENISRWAKTGGGRNRAGKAHKAAAPQEAEAPLPEDALEGEDGSRGGEPA